MARILVFIYLICVLGSSASLADRRVALVIGNSNYAVFGRLPNPAKDARAIADELQRLGFDVTHADNLGIGAMRKALAAFEEKATGADWALVYYAGHGIELDGKNWLVPVDATFAKASDVADEAVPLERVLERVRLAGSLRIVVLDACRSNPFVSRMIMGAGGTRSIGRGLAPIQPQRGEVVFYSARDGHVALDGDGAHSPFAMAILQALQKPGLELGWFFREVTSDVLDATSQSQEPFVYGTLPRQQYYFKTPENVFKAPENVATKTNSRIEESSPPLIPPKPLEEKPKPREETQIALAKPEPKPSAEAQARSLFDQAQGALNRREYEIAEANFQQFLDQYPNDALAGSAQYSIGESFFARGEYRNAADRFLKTFTSFPNNERTPEALLKLGISLHRLGQNVAACDSFAELKRRYPQGPKAVLLRAGLEKKMANCG